MVMGRWIHRFFRGMHCVCQKSPSGGSTCACCLCAGRRCSTTHSLQSGVMVSAGGAAGGIFVVLVATQTFTGFWEFHFGLIACVVVAIVALIRDRSSWWHNAQPYLGMIILLGLALVPDFLSRYITLAVVPEMMYRAHYYPILTALALITAVVFFTTRNKPHTARRFNLAQLAAVAVLAALCAALYICVAFDKSREVRRDRNFYSALQIQKGS